MTNFDFLKQDENNLKKGEIKRIANGAIDNIATYLAPAASSLLSAAVGGALAGPEGMILGSFVGTAIENLVFNVANDIKERSMSKSEQRKVETVFNSSFSKINEKIEQGQNLRSDDFYEALEEDRSAAEELLEGTIFAAQRENEEKKLKYISNLYANINFDENISRSTANQLVKLSSNISYRQLIILSIIGRSSSKLIDLQLRNEEFKGFSRSEDFSIAVDVFELYRMSLISSSKVILEANSFNPSMLILSGVGELLYNNMELANMESNDDYEEIIEFLSNNSDDYSEPDIVGRLAVEDRINELQNNVVYFGDMDDAIEEKTSDLVPQKQFNSAMAALEAEKSKKLKSIEGIFKYPNRV